MIERQDSGTARDNDQEAGRPDAMRWPGIGIDEDLDHRRHEEQREGGKAARKSQH